MFEAAGYSVFGAMAINAAAPDEGNIHLLAHVATPAQREEFLAPLARVEVRSAFAMTEPAPGAGSDPAALATTGERVPGGWRINGRKIFITGADGAGFFIIMARTAGKAGDRGGGTMFLAHAGTPGIAVGRHVPTMDRSMVGGHCEVVFDGLVVPDDAVFGEVDAGFVNLQVRLGPARMTHVMRWLGAAVRAQEVALDYATTRRAFGGSLADQGLAQQLIADNEIDPGPPAPWSMSPAARWTRVRSRHRRPPSPSGRPRPPGCLTSSAHDMAREHRVTSALAGTSVPVARPVDLCEDLAVLGAPFTVAQWVDGVVVRDRAELAAIPDPDVALHALDIDAVGLTDFGRPDGFLSRQVALWRRQWEAAQTRALPDLERLHALLAGAVPASSAAAVVHGDYRIDNVILDRSDAATVLAVVDWELSTLGDPLSDVALMCVYRHPALDAVLGVPAAWASPRLPSPADLAESYARASGRDLGQWPFYLGLAYLKLAVIAEGIAHRAHAGAAAGPGATHAARAVPELVAAGLGVLRVP